MRTPLPPPPAPERSSSAWRTTIFLIVVISLLITYIFTLQEKSFFNTQLQQTVPASPPEQDKTQTLSPNGKPSEPKPLPAFLLEGMSPSPTIATTTTTSYLTVSPSTRIENAAPSTPTRALPKYAGKNWLESTCMNKPAPKSTREYQSWADCKIDIPRNLIDDATVHTALPFDLNPTAIFGIIGYDRGQLCNKLGMFAGMFRQMEVSLGVEGMKKAIVAYDHVFSPMAWPLDLELLSSKVMGVLLDCDPCGGVNSRPFLMRCRNIVIKGKVYDVAETHMFTLTSAYAKSALDAFYGNRPNTKGYMESLNTMIQPQRAIRYMVEQIMGHEFNANGKEYTVGIHQRYMDGFCFEWMPHRIHYQCHPNADFNADAKAMYDKFYLGDRKEYFGDAKQSTYLLRTIPAEDRKEFETSFPQFISCNYSLSPTQVQVLRTVFPPLFARSPIKILLATDGQTPAAEAEMRQIQFGTVHKLQDYESCFAKARHHNMLADMWALSMTDLHMGNTISSCDDIVAHWRTARGKRAESSHPQRCYQGHYDRIQK